MIIIGIGSNLSSSFGDKFKNIQLAISFLQNNGIKIIKKSSFYETPSYPDINNPKFINIVVSIETEFNPKELMSVLISIEEKLERKRHKKNEPRTCDLDIIDYKGIIKNFNSSNIYLTLPHKELTSRNFVLFPLKEIYPSWKHPKTNENIDDLIYNLSKDQKMSILKIKKN